MLNERLRTIDELQLQTKKFIEQILAEAKQATPEMKALTDNEVNYSYKIRRPWQRSKNPTDKREFNRIIKNK